MKIATQWPSAPAPRGQSTGNLSESEGGGPSSRSVFFVFMYNKSIMPTHDWYSQLIKPSWSPPAWLFGPVWTVLYIIIAVSFGSVIYKAFTGGVQWLIALPFVLNLVFNFAFTSIQFGLKNNLLASIDILLVLITLVWALVAIWQSVPELRWVVYVNIPYLVWVSFATVLQLTITSLNLK